MTLLRLLILLSLTSRTAFAQDGLVLREAVHDYRAESAAAVAGMELAQVGRNEDSGAGDLPERVYLGDVLLTFGAGDVLSVGAEPDPHGPSGMARYVVTLVLASGPSEAFGDLTAARVGEPMAIVLDGEVLSAPYINEAIRGASFQISGGSQDEARALADAVRDATGAVGPEAARRRDIAAFRARVDASTPEALAESLLGAIEAGDVLTLAGLLHPAALETIRTERERYLDLRDSTFATSPRDAAERMPASTVIERAGGPPYTHVEIAAMALVASDASTSDCVLRNVVRSAGSVEETWWGQSVARLVCLDESTLVGVVREPRLPVSESERSALAYLVFEPLPSGVLFLGGGMSASRVIGVRQVDDAWRVLLPVGL